MSRSQDLDTIKFVVNQTVFIEQEAKVVYIKDGEHVLSTVPPQITDEFPSTLSTSEVSTLGIGMMAGNILLNILISGVICYLWKALSDLSSLTILFMIAIPIFGSAQAISASIL